MFEAVINLFRNFPTLTYFSPEASVHQDAQLQFKDKLSRTFSHLDGRLELVSTSDSTGCNYQYDKLFVYKVIKQDAEMLDEKKLSVEYIVYGGDSVTDDTDFLEEEKDEPYKELWVYYQGRTLDIWTRSNNEDYRNESRRVILELFRDLELESTTNNDDIRNQLTKLLHVLLDVQIDSAIYAQLVALLQPKED